MKIPQELKLEDITYGWIHECDDKDMLKQAILLIEQDGNYFLDLKKSIEKKLSLVDQRFRNRQEAKQNIDHQAKDQFVNELNDWAQNKESFKIN